ncbi:hypothetical protein [Bradyrhizobium zhanjiangense]|uniref:hypothetical protein n=1 Tax=Bradyrhizobium zhanjiangense TaxID=1325107 RepID=UPI0013E8D7E8|nr:hypothetical protein [Bradyrhizobium zhanjiangense]
MATSSKDFTRTVRPIQLIRSFAAPKLGASPAFCFAPHKPVLQQHNAEGQQVSPVWQAVFGMFRRKRNSIQQGKLLVAAYRYPATAGRVSPSEY